MFTGIIEEVGSIISIQQGAEVFKLIIQANKIMQDIHLGDSVAVNGICLTVISCSEKSFSVDVMNETLNRSEIKKISVNTLVNLERAMVASDRLGGHIVSGHIDGSGKIVRIKKDANAVWFFITADSKILRYIIEKGSVAIDGISLTVVSVEKETFSVSVIPYTYKHTILAQKKVGDSVNIENDCIGKYIEHFIHFSKKSKITAEFLSKNGF